MAFPEWMGPNIEPRHVEMMGWRTAPAPTPIGVPPLRQDPPNVENCYTPTTRYVVLLQGGRQFAVYAHSFHEAEQSVVDLCLGDPVVRVRAIRADVEDLWIGEGDAARCCVLVDGRKAVG